MRKVLAVSGLALALGAPAWGGIVWDNGPLITTFGGGFNGADVSELWTTGGANTLGFGHQVTAGNRVADNFTLTVDTFLKTATFFAYQTNSTTQSTITSVNVRIWDGVPGQGGSNIVFGDTGTNRMLSTGWSGIYRATDTAPLGNARPIMEQLVDLENVLLPAGDYWIDWQTDGTLSSGPWAPPVTIPNDFYVGDALQSISDNGVTWGAALDSGNGLNVDFPFLLDGNAVPAPGALALLALGAFAARRRR